MSAAGEIGPVTVARGRDGGEPRASVRGEDFPVPGTDLSLRYEYDDAGALTRISCGACVYLETTPRGRRFGDLALVREVPLPSGLLRHGSAGGRAWTEEYRWDAEQRPTHVDGTEIRRDARGRVIACLVPGGGWFYGWDGDHLASIEGPAGARTFAYDERGRPVQAQGRDGARAIEYDAAGARAGTPRPPGGWHRDAAGRLWTVTGADGTVLATYLWDRFSCLGRIDGPPGAPLAAVFSLDPTLTPVRVTTRAGQTRIPRDAFGEGLLAHPGTPGLYGGAVHRGHVFYRGRALDPTLGSFDAPDPFDGGPGDPRRREGFAGALAVEDQPGGAYAVCQGDPVTRLDPTGEASTGWTIFYLVLTDLTWASQYLLGGILFMDCFVNLLYSLISFSCLRKGGKFDRKRGINFFSKSGMYSERTGTYGYRADALWATGWTMHHVFWETKEFYNELDRLRCFVPKSAFTPTLYGTLLRCTPGSETPFLLDTTSRRLTRAWSRAGGKAAPLVPGSRVPVFPEGGFHFEQLVADTIVGPMNGELAELDPTGQVAKGKIIERLILVVDSKGLGLSKGKPLFLADAGGKIELLDVRSAAEHDGKTRIRTAKDTAFAIGTKVRARGLSVRAEDKAPPAPGVAAKDAPNVPFDDTLAAAGPGLDARRTAGAALAAKRTYKKDEPLRVTSGAAAAVAAGSQVKSLEVQLTVDAALGALTPPLTVKVAQPGGAAKKLTRDAGDAALLTFPAGEAPSVGALIAVTSGADADFTARRVIAEAGANQRRVDRDLPAAFPAAPASLDWKKVEAGLALGTGKTAPAAATLSYQPELTGVAPAKGHVFVKDADGTVAVRDVKSLDWDAIVLADGPGGPIALAGNCKVARFTFADPDEDDTTVDKALVFAMDTAADFGGDPVTIYQLAVPTAAPVPTSLEGLSLAGTTATLSYAGGAVVAPGAKPATEAALATVSFPVPGAAVGLVGAAGAAAADVAVVKKVRLTVQLDRPHGFAAGPLDAVRLQDTGPGYLAERRAADKVTVLPRVKAPGVFAGEVLTEMPRFTKGELVHARWTADEDVYRVKDVEGTTLDLENGKALPDPAPDLQITRLEPQGIDGRARLGIEGVPVAGKADQATLAVWSPDALHKGPGFFVGITDQKDRTLPAQILAVTKLAVDLGAVPAGVGAAPLALGLPNWQLVEPRVSYPPQDGPDIDLVDTKFVASPNPAFAVRYAGGRKVAGEFHSGTVLVPDDPESKFEYTRGKAVDEHELSHTRQYAWFGPLMWSFVPWGALVEGIAEASSNAEELGFFYSKDVAARLTTQGGTRILEIPDAGGVEFGPGKNTQIVQGTVVVDAQLGDARGAGFQVTVGLALADGDVRARLLQSRSGAAEKANDVIGALSTWSMGGISTFVVEAVVKGIVELVSVIDRKVKNLPEPTDDTGRTFFPATVPDPARPRAIRVGARPDGALLTLKRYDRVQIKGGSSTHVFHVAEDGTVELETPPPTSGAERALEVAQVTADDPFFNVEKQFFTGTGFDALRAIFDPWGRLHLDTQRDNHPGLDAFLRTLRYLFGAHSWTFIPLLGFWFFTDGSRKKPHRSWMEQYASDNSGEMYSPTGKLSAKPEFVGDIARYWYFEGWRGNDTFRFFAAADGHLEEPGIHYRHYPRVLPAVTAGPAAAPNGPVTTPSTHYEGLDLADAFADKSRANPHDADATVLPSGFAPSARGFIPTPAGVQRSEGMYVGFTRDGKHRITVSEEIPEAADAQDAQEEGKSQTIYHDVQIKPVKVVVGGVEIPSPTHAPATAPPGGGAPPDPLGELFVLELLATQRATVTVEPASGRRYAVSALRPKTGDVLRVETVGVDPVIVAQRVLGKEEVVEVSRHYPHDAAKGFGGTALAAKGVHLPADIHVPVRWLKVKVVDVVPVREKAEAAAPKVDAVAVPRKPGDEIFLLVPAAILKVLSVKATTYDAGAPALKTDPAPAISVEKTPDKEKTFIGVGAVFKVVFAGADPPEHPLKLELNVDVGKAGNSAALKVEVKLVPHFTLAPTGTVELSAAAGGDLELTPSGGVVPEAASITVTPSDGVTPTVRAGKVVLTVAKGAPLGERRVLVSNQADVKQKARLTFRVIA